MFRHCESYPFLNPQSDSRSVINRIISQTNRTLSVLIPPWRCNGGVQRIPIHAYVYSTKLEHIGSECPRHSREPISLLETSPVEGGYCLVESCRNRQLLVNLDSSTSAFHFFSFQALTSSDFSSSIQIFLLKSDWMNSKTFPLTLN